MTQILHRTALATALALGLGATTASWAQQAPPPQPPAQQQAPVNVGDQDLQTFAEAQERVAQISQKWNARAQQAKDNSPQAMQKMQQSATDEMVVAVETAGLSVQEYNQIAQAVQSDPDLQSKLQEIRSN